MLRALTLFALPPPIALLLLLLTGAGVCVQLMPALLSVRGNVERRNGGIRVGESFGFEATERCCIKF